MLPIYICEDHPAELALIQNYVENYMMFQQNEENPQIFAFTKPHDMLRAVEAGAHTGIYFLDIDLNCQMNGLATAERLRQIDPRGFLVFITTHAEMMPETFKRKVEAFDYIVKDTHLQAQIDHALADILSRYTLYKKNTLSGTPQRVTIKARCGCLFFFVDEIIAVSSTDAQHRLLMYLKNGEQRFYGSLKQLQQDLPADRFFRCDRSAIVNIAHIVRVDSAGQKLLMDSGDSFPISREGLRKLRKKIGKHPL